MTLAHHLFLDGVLHIFDVDEGLAADVEAICHRTGDFNCGLGVEVQGKEGLANSDLDLGLAPGHHLAVAADQADGNWLALDSALRLVTTEHEAAGHIMRVVLDQCLLNQKVDVVSR